jgi:hypothetical protein
MRRLMFALVFVCVMAPTAARANGGGFWEWIYGLDPKLQGWGTDIHLLCLKADGSRIKGCEEFWMLHPVFPKNATYTDLKHEFNVRVVYYREYGQSFSTSNANSINALKFMGMYEYYADSHITVGLGAGIMRFYGTSSDGLDFNSFTRGVLTPLSATYAPATHGGILARSFYVRGESTFFTDGFSPGDFDNRLPKTETRGEWQASVGAGFDFRRRTFAR